MKPCETGFLESLRLNFRPELSHTPFLTRQVNFVAPVTSPDTRDGINCGHSHHPIKSRNTHLAFGLHHCDSNEPSTHTIFSVVDHGYICEDRRALINYIH